MGGAEASATAAAGPECFAQAAPFGGSRAGLPPLVWAPRGSPSVDPKLLRRLPVTRWSRRRMSSRWQMRPRDQLGGTGRPLPSCHDQELERRKEQCEEVLSLHLHRRCLPRAPRPMVSLAEAARALFQSIEDGDGHRGGSESRQRSQDWVQESPVCGGTVVFTGSSRREW